MRLLIYSDMSSAPWGGSEILWSRLLPLFTQRGTAVALTAFASDQARQACRDSDLADVFLLPRSTARSPQQALPKTLSRLSGRAIQRARQRVWFERQRRFCERFAPEVAFVSMAWPEAASDLHPFLRKTNIPYVCFLHGIAEGYAARQASAERQAFFQGASQVFTTGRRSAHILEQWLGHSLVNKVPTLNFVNCDYFSPERPPSATSRSGTTRLLCVARLSLRDKGQDVLLESLSRLSDLNWRMTLAGDGPDRHLLEDQATRLGLQDRVDFLGDTPITEVRQLLSSHDVFVLSSRTEGLPLSLLEAMATQLPCVATDVGSIQEVLVHEESGLLVQPEDAAGLSEALRRMIQDAPLRERCAARASAIVRSQCNEGAFLERVAGLIEESTLDSEHRVA
jgi:glycosyltransferase involved in cell wall biosynthesis